MSTKIIKKSSVVSPLAQIKEIESDPKLIKLVEELLPPNYDFEIGKTIWRIRKIPNCETVALQMPEGLLLFATKVARVLNELTGVEAILLGDVTYGACCIDDFTASLLGADLLVHYGHSCLVPTTVANRLDTIYVFVTIKINLLDAVNSIDELVKSKMTNSSSKMKIEYENVEKERPGIKISLVSTIQFALSLPQIKNALLEQNSLNEQVKLNITIPRSKPLSSGEILGCTAPKVNDDLIIYVGDGRFHLEAMMMANPNIESYRYDPYNKAMTKELFDHEALSKNRKLALLPFTTNKDKRLRIGIILGTLGRQGNPKPLEHVFQKLTENNHDCFIVLMSEVLPDKLTLFENVDLWVQFACPRLSIDWGNAYKVPILTPFEATYGCENKDNINSNYEGHPMDYYSYDSLGPHTPNFVKAKC